MTQSIRPRLNHGIFDAERMNPLALMIRPHGSSPHHSVALVPALTAIRASKPSVGSHHFVGALESVR
jgi:hypothetical protein